MDSADPVPSPPVSQRLLSLDVLRGFDMFWILGMEAVGVAIGRLSDAPWAQTVKEQLDHVEWAGFHFLDLIFPLFVFISGASLVYSADRSVGLQGKRGTLWKMVKRALILYFLGLLTYGFLSGGVGEVRWMGVLQRIAICGLAGGAAYLYLGRMGRLYLTLGLLAGYWALMTFVPVPGFGAGDFAEGHNLANWLDANFLPGRKWDGDHDPEGLLSTLPAIATALLGIFTGEWLKRGPAKVWKKAGGLLLAGAALAALGWAWDLQFPVVKKLWTSSLVLVAGGYSLMLLSFFYVIVDGLRWQRAFLPFIWIGMNPITLYMLDHFIDYKKLTTSLFGGPFADGFGYLLGGPPGAWYNLVLALGVVVINLVLARFLYTRKVFLKV